MGMKNSNTLIMAAYDDLQKLINGEFADMKLQAFLNRFENVLVGVKDIANMHNVSGPTVTAYMKDGLIVPELRDNENAHPQFRMSYALTLDFKALQKELRARSK